MGTDVNRRRFIAFTAMTPAASFASADRPVAWLDSLSLPLEPASLGYWRASETLPAGLTLPGPAIVEPGVA